MPRKHILHQRAVCLALHARHERFHDKPLLLRGRRIQPQFRQHSGHFRLHLVLGHHLRRELLIYLHAQRVFRDNILTAVRLLNGFLTLLDFAQDDGVLFVLREVGALVNRLVFSADSSSDSASLRSLSCSFIACIIAARTVSIRDIFLILS